MKVALIQARMSSTRLPGKTLMDIAGKPVIWHVVERVKRAKNIDRIIVVTSTDKSDDKLAGFCTDNGINIFRGSLENVLDRYYQAAKSNRADIIVRVTGDCPLIDPEVLDELVDLFKSGRYDYVSNNKPPSYPHGLDAEVFSFEALEKAWKEATLQSEKEHVTPYIWKNIGKFKVGNLTNNETTRYSQKELAELRWTLDYTEDLNAIRKIYDELGEKAITHDFSWMEIFEIVDKNPDIRKINHGFDRLEGYKKSVKKDQ